jgi:hypothetical protein
VQREMDRHAPVGTPLGNRHLLGFRPSYRSDA